MSGVRSTVIDAYLADLDRYLAVPRRYRRRVLSETADHLAEATDTLRAASGAAQEAEASAGLTDPAAQAVRRFGSAGRLAAEVNAGWASARARRAPGIAFLAGAGVFAAAVGGIPSVPTTAGSGSRTLVAVASTVAFLALQLGVVAGGVALLRVLARRSTAVLDSGDLGLVWHAARLGVTATAVAGAGFLAVAALQAQRTGAGPARLVAAAAAMVVVLAPALSALRLRRPAAEPGIGVSAAGPRDVESGSAATDAHRWPRPRVGAVERVALIAENGVTVARSSPVWVTVFFAGICAIGSYGHAEASRPASLLAAVVEAAAVVVFARIYGPSLGLTRPAFE